jgi:hypothetical protein
MAIMHIEAGENGISVMITPNGEGAGSPWFRNLNEFQVVSMMRERGVAESDITSAIGALRLGKGVDLELP